MKKMGDELDGYTKVVLDDTPEEPVEGFPEVPEGEGTKRKRRRRTAEEKAEENQVAGKTMKITLISLAAVLFVAYVAGVIVFWNRFLPDTVVNGVSIGKMTAQEAKNEFLENKKAHELTIVEKERSEKISPEEIDLVINITDEVDQLMEAQLPYGWFLHLWGENPITKEMSVTYDAAELTELINGLECFKKENVVAPVNATIAPGQTAFEIVPEILGNTVKKEELADAITQALATWQREINLEQADLYELPTVYKDDPKVAEAVKQADAYTHGSITYDFKYTTEKVDYEKSKDWIKCSKDYKVSFNKSKVGDYVQELCRRYNTMGAARDFTTTGGRKMNIYQGDYGWKIYFDKEKAQLLKDLESGQDVSREPIYSYKAMVRNGPKDDVGNSYVEVSISAQTLWLYIDGKCILSTDCVTGNPNRKAGTTRGIYGITYKKSPETLTGPNADGSTYESKVTYWMPFNGNQGLHDASWRDTFGGNIYKTKGSHGCVNLPTWAAAEIYTHVQAGFPVVIY